MKISIITVCMNSALFIADTIHSVDSQTWPDIEHLVIDGASTDATLDIVNAHPQPWRHVISEPDQGIYHAMNKGLRLATGDFVGFLNADDVFADAESVGHIAEAAGKTAVDAVYGDLLYVDKDRPADLIRYWRSGAFERAKLRYGWMPPHPTLYIRCSRIDEFGPFDAGFKISADYEFILRYLDNSALGVAYVPRVLVRMRTGGASNRSLSALVRKSREDLRALRSNHVGGVLSLLCKNVRKLPQFLMRPRAPDGLGVASRPVG